MPWNSLMDRMMKELHAQGKTIDDIAEVLKRVPIHLVPASKAAHALGEYFSEINSNPDFVDEERRLRIFPYHDNFTKCSHGNNLCSPNMCKVSYCFTTYVI
ncbi:Pyridoxal phosphate phosphatase-related protein, putative [Theobroma cacao]|uniref:Pyridoxal phosphate phosphatase-related protein, putative n=1 Tax=Theobroma cacao TaxID=3641 RepID=A0A061F842_THECC|nr:Pyridoxal phosphate phosphatase-related protein, putative [Theobroma cacao]